RQYRAAVLAAVGPGADHGDRRRRRDADRPGPGRRLLHADGAPAQRADGGVGALLRPDLHRLRAVRAPGDLGTGDDAAAARHPEALNVPLLELDGVTRRYGALVALDQV